MKVIDANASPTKQVINANQLAALSQMPMTDFLLEVFRDYRTAGLYLPGDVSAHLRGEFEYADALAIEIARQIGDDIGIPLITALNLVSYTGACERHLGYQHFVGVEPTGIDHDFWLAVLASRASWGDEPRGSWPVTSFGSAEYWHRMHFVGSYDGVFAEMRDWMGRMDQYHQLESDPARIVIANVSAADRRLRKRAAELGIKLRADDDRWRIVLV